MITASLILSDLQRYRCNDSFVAQQRMANKPKDGQDLPDGMIHIGMKNLMNILQNAVAYPPVVATKFAFNTECQLKYQRLEWPNMLRTHGQLIMANGQKIRIQTAKPIDADAIRKVKRAGARDKLINSAQQLDIDLVEEVGRREDCAMTWATIDEMAKMTHQSDVIPAAEVPADEIVIEDDAIIDLDSGVSSSHTTPAPTPDVIVMPSRSVAPRVPIPSARAPTPEESTRPSMMVQMLKQVLESQDKLLEERKNLETKMDKHGDTITKLEAMYESTTKDLATLRLEIQSKPNQVINYDQMIKTKITNHRHQIAQEAH